MKWRKKKKMKQVTEIGRKKDLRKFGASHLTYLSTVVTVMGAFNA